MNRIRTSSNINNAFKLVELLNDLGCLVRKDNFAALYREFPSLKTIFLLPLLCGMEYIPKQIQL